MVEGGEADLGDWAEFRGLRFLSFPSLPYTTPPGQENNQQRKGYRLSSSSQGHLTDRLILPRLNGPMESPAVASDPDQSVTSSSISEIPESDRTNRFQGPPSTWRNLTADDRLASSSLASLRNQDLSIHLYNAHSMKTRFYDKGSISVAKPWASKDRWRGSRPGEQDESGSDFVPPKFWTAWPLSADVIPRTGEQVGPDDGAEEWTLKKEGLQRPSRELEEMLMAITLRISKDRFEGRKRRKDTDPGKTGVEGNDVNMDSDGHEEVKHESVTVSRELPQEMPHESVRSSREASSEMKDTSQNRFGLLDDRVLRDPSQKAERRLNSPSIPNGNSGASPKGVSLPERPVVSADDERSNQLLRPTIRHSLSRLDELLLALHHARQTCFHYGSDHTESQSDFEVADQDVDVNADNYPLNQPAPAVSAEKISLEQPLKRPGPGRPPKLLYIPAPSTENIFDTLEPQKEDRRGRKRKIYAQLQGESREEMLVRIARLQKKAMPFTAQPTGSATSSPAKSAQSSPQRRGTSVRAWKRRSMRLGLRDWSEILGAAALIGFSPRVIDRAVQRCTSLFGEGMTMHSLVENPTSGNEDQRVDYLPGEIPDFDNLDSSTGTESEDDDEKAPKSGRQPPKRRKYSSRSSSMDKTEIKKSEPDMRISPSRDPTFPCPYPACVRYMQGFAQKLYLSSHLQRVHKLDKQGLRAAMEDSEDEMEGGAHVDGYMKELKRRTGWRAIDGKPRQRSKGARIIKPEEKRSGGPVDVPEVEVLSRGSSSGRDADERSLDEAFESD